MELVYLKLVTNASGAQWKPYIMTSFGGCAGAVRAHSRPYGPDLSGRVRHSVRGRTPGFHKRVRWLQARSGGCNPR